MAHNPNTCPPGGRRPPPFPQEFIPEAQHCRGCNVVLWSVVGIDLQHCAVCRMKGRASMSLQQLQEFAEHLQLVAARRRGIGALSAAAEFEIEARMVLALLEARRLEALAHG